ncbi:GNAT family N-acetyltransferase [Microbacterium sp.]|uniref:GNAT family N-acetyltransferase n=1 Tax=Microbacterium sp. TaxID=51671 RepID=UPI00260D8527|nr:GNAT family N-acetyltransferase [Microbacterium sp.]
MTDAPTVTRNDEAARYEIHVGETLAGFAEIRLRDGEVQFTHTEVDPAFQGKGLASILAGEALADAAASGATIVPYCAYIASFLKRNEVAGANVRWPQLPDDPTDATRQS